MEREQYRLLYESEESLWWFAGMRRIAAALLGERIRLGLRCLEAGCGTGFNARFFADAYGWEVVPFDLSREALGYARRRGIARLSRATVTDLPFRDRSFDAATCLDVLVSLDRPSGERALRELHRVLVPGGLLLLRTAALPALGGRHGVLVHEVKRYRLGELRQALEQAGFAIERSTYANAALLPAAALKRLVLDPLGLGGAGGDVRPLAPWLDRVLRGVLELEARAIAAGRDLPIGLSAIVLARRRG